MVIWDDKRVSYHNSIKKNKINKGNKKEQIKKIFIGTHRRPSLAHIRYRSSSNYYEYINVVTNKRLKKFTDNPMCVICFESIKQDKFTSDCNHAYHKKCIKKWSNHTYNRHTYHKKTSCPTCRKDITSELIAYKLIETHNCNYNYNTLNLNNYYTLTRSLNTFSYLRNHANRLSDEQYYTLTHSRLNFSYFRRLNDIRLNDIRMI